MKRRALLGALLAGGCAGSGAALIPGAVPGGGIALALVARALHTDIGVPEELVPAHLRAIWTRGLPSRGQVSFGYGQRDYMMSNEPGSAEALRALFTSPGVIAVGVLPRRADQAGGVYDATELRVDEAGRDRLLRHVEADMARDGEGPVGAIDGRPYSGRNLFLSRRDYNAVFTCNTWVADALRVAGLPFETAGVAWPGDVMRQAHRIAAAQHRV